MGSKEAAVAKLEQMIEDDPMMDEEQLAAIMNRIHALGG
jgi:hypothetical protein